MSPRERQRWLAALALAAAIPLPLTGLASWLFLLPYLAVAAWCLLVPRPVPAPPVWLENLLAPLILIAVAAAGGIRYGVLRPLTHLALLLAAVRLAGSGEPRRARGTLLLLALVGVASVASSTHPALAVYLLVLLVATVTAVARATLLSLADRDRRGQVEMWPPARLLGATAAITLLIAVPVFTVMPRLRSPFAGSPFGAMPVSGFRNSVTLHGIGDIKVSQQVALVVRFPGAAVVQPEWLRLTGATLTRYRAGSWVEGHSRGTRLVPDASGVAELVGGSSAASLQRADISLVKRSANLFLPPGARRLEPPADVAVQRDATGTLVIPDSAEPPLGYVVWFDSRHDVASPPTAADLAVPERIVPVLRDAAAEMAPTSVKPTATALAIESYLQQRFRYSLKTYAPVREDPVVWFLTRGREGHCEFFASAMALLLRVKGIPARVQVGFVGGTPDGDGGFEVRDSRAHAWVLAFVDARWRVFDPTPPDGQPGFADAAAAASWRWSWDRVEGWWDRWVLTFSLTDQVEVLRKVVEAVWARRLGIGLTILASLALLLSRALLARILSRLGRVRAVVMRPRAERVTRALEKVIAVAASRGLSSVGVMTPARFGRDAAAAFPASSAALTWLVAAHERCCYAGGTAPPSSEVRRHERDALRGLLASGGVRLEARPQLPRHATPRQRRRSPGDS